MTYLEIGSHLGGSGADGRLALGHRRLAVIDLAERAAQPMVSACGRFVLSFNGEIYNYRELRKELVACGCRLRRASDTVAKADLVTAVSRHTRRRFLAWADDLEPHRVRVLPYTVEPRFTPGPKPAQLLERYGLIGKRVLLTVRRLSAAERYKGHDRVIAVLPAPRARFPNLAYVVAGDGDDRPRLEALAREFSVADLVRFLGHVPDRELVEHYRMAEVFVLPSTGEGFGIAFLEAMACDLPAIGGDANGSIDPLSAVGIGLAVPVERIGDAIAHVLEHPSRDARPDDLASRFGLEAFTAQLAGLIASFTATGR
jgi:phosphatidylinositol alpha-1,6-mannosyltransferase